MIKLNAAVQTAADFEELGALFGFAITVSAGTAFATLPYDIPFPVIGGPPGSRFTIVVEVPVTGAVLPYDIPFIVGDVSMGQMQCFFNKLKPANVTIVFLETP